MDRKFTIVANWKANKTVAGAQEWIKRLAESGKQIESESMTIEVVVAAPYPLLNALRSTPDATLASQDISMFSVGAYTGEVPGELLKDVGVEYCLVGHSERRKYLGETTEMVGKKVDQAIKNKIIPIICAQSGEEIPENVRNYSPEQYLIMYEPFEAISTEGKYHPEDPNKITETLQDWQKHLPAGVQFLYGGSVNSNNVHQILATSNQQLVSGFVVGHASLDPEEFFSIIKRCLLTPSV